MIDSSSRKPSLSWSPEAEKIALPGDRQGTSSRASLLLWGAPSAASFD
jgi:hypothetical protein